MENIKNTMKKAVQVNKEVKAIKVAKILEHLNESMTFSDEDTVCKNLCIACLNLLKNEDVKFINSDAYENLIDAVDFLVTSGQVDAEEPFSESLIDECLSEVEYLSREVAINYWDTF